MGTMVAFFSRVWGYFLLILLTFVIVNDSAILPWNIMEMVWYGLMPVTGFMIGFLYGKGFSRRGGSIFAALFFAFPLLVAAYIGRLPFYGQLVEPLHLAAFIFLAAFGEAFFRTNSHLQAKGAFKTMASYVIINSKIKKSKKEEEGDGKHSPEGD